MKCKLAISGWLTTPVKQMQDDANKHATQEDIDQMVELFLQCYWEPQDTKELQQKHDDDLSAEFLRGYHEFSTHTGGLFGSEHPCWQNTGIKCADWHFVYSLCGGVFVHFAHRVATKILGSGDAERCFKYLKDARSQKRTRLTPEWSKKQVTLIWFTTLR